MSQFRVLGRLSFLCALLTAAPSSAQTLWDSNSLKGSWELAEIACVSSMDQREVIGPGLPGEHEEWNLKILDNGPKGSFQFSALYIGLMGQDCRISFQGGFQLQQTPGGGLASIKLLPQKNSVKKAGGFEAPCRIFSPDRPQLFEARLEMGKDKVGRNVPRLRMRGKDLQNRCVDSVGENEYIELLFESI